MIRAKNRCMFLEFDTPHRASLSGEATSGTAGAPSPSNTAYRSIDRQTAFSTQELWTDPGRHIRIHAIRAGVLQRARCWPLVRLGLALVFVAGNASAELEPDECIAAHASAQELVDSGKLLEARKKFESCATSGCPKVIQRDCKVLGTAVEKSMPTLNLTAVDHNGQAIAGFGLEVDGVALPLDASHQPLSLDPGNHRIKVIVSGRQAADVLVTVRKQEKNQSAVIQLAAPDPAASKVRTAGYVLAGVGAVGLLSFVGFGISGYVDQGKLEDNSGHTALGNDYGLADRMRRKYVIADMSLGIGLVSLGAATYLLLVTRDSTEHALPVAKTALYLHGAPGGGAIVLRSEF